MLRRRQSFHSEVCSTGHPAVTVRQWRAHLLALTISCCVHQVHVPHSIQEWKTSLTDLAPLATGRLVNCSRNWCTPAKGYTTGLHRCLSLVWAFLDHHMYHYHYEGRTPNITPFSKMGDLNDRSAVRNRFHNSSCTSQVCFSFWFNSTGLASLSMIPYFYHKDPLIILIVLA